MSRTLQAMAAALVLVSCADAPYERRLVSHTDRYHVLKSDPHDRVAAERNQQPIQIELYKVRGLLSECHYTYFLYGEWSRPLRIFTPEQIDDLAPRIWEALAEAGPYERLHFTSSRIPFGLVRETGDPTVGWLYLAGDRWHIGFSVLNGHPFHGGRERPGADSGDDPFFWEVWPYPGQRYHIDRGGNEHRDALELPLGWPDANEGELPDWRKPMLWDGYETLGPRFYQDSEQPPKERYPSDRYWDREYLWDDGR